MTDYGQGTGSVDTEPRSISGWVTGAVAFAAVMMILIGVFQALAGIAAIANDEFFVVGQNYAFDLDVTAWGWIHLLLGVLVLLAGICLPGVCGQASSRSRWRC